MLSRLPYSQAAVQVPTANRRAIQRSRRTAATTATTGELLAGDGRSNEQKGDGDAATWLPANKPFRCSYLAVQVYVKASYQLWVTQAEHDAMARILNDCPAAAVEPAGAPTAHTGAAAANRSTFSAAT